MNEQTPSRYQRAFNSYINLVRQSAYFAAAAGKTALRPVLWGLEAPGQLRTSVSERLLAELPRSEARIALEAILQGRAYRDATLRQTGEAMLTKAVQTATTSREVPDEVVQEVLQIAHDVHLAPEETFVDPFVARHVREELERFDGDRR